MATNMTVRELLQYKNEIERAIKAILAGPRASYLFGDREAGNVSYGVTHIDGVKQEHSGEPFAEHLSRLDKLMQLNDLVQTRLAKVNLELEIPSMVRRRENAKAQLVLVDQAIQKSKPRTETEIVSIAGGGVQRVSKTFEPWTTSASLKKHSKALRSEIRRLQTAIDAANATAVEVNFDFSLIDDLLSPDIPEE